MQKRKGCCATVVSDHALFHFEVNGLSDLFDKIMIT